MTENNETKSGMVSIVGRPNVGKSTLLNTLIGSKIAIVSTIPQTTRNQVRGIYNDERGQIVFIDTPGLHKGKDRLDAYMNASADSGTDGADVIIHLVDVTDHVGPDEEQIAQRINALGVEVVLGLNKVDHRDKYIPDYIALWEKIKGCPAQEFKDVTILPLSGKTGLNTEKLLDCLFDALPEGPGLYPTDMISDTPKRIAISDIIREKLYHVVRDEIPHSVAVMIEQMRPVKGKTFRIDALILVSTTSQKAIVVGKNGDNLKHVGTAARVELEELLGQKVFLGLHVKTKKKWRESDSALRELGYEF